MTEIVEEQLATLPEDWQFQVARAYAVMSAPSPFVMESSLDEFYSTVPFDELYDDLLSEGDEYGAAWLELRVLDDLEAALSGADELALGRWLEHLHPRGEGGLFREVRGRRLAAEADRAYRMFLHSPHSARTPRSRDTWRREPGSPYRIKPRTRAHEMERVRHEVQSMVDRGAPIEEIQDRLGLGTQEARRAAERRLIEAEIEQRDTIEELKNKLSDAYFGPPAKREAIREELRMAEARRARKIRYHG